MVIKLEELRERLDAAPRISGGHRRYSAQLKAQAIEYVNTQGQAGVSMSRIAQELGVAMQTFGHWQKPSKKSKCATRVLEPVVVLAAKKAPAQTPSTLSLQLSSGHRVEGLSLTDVVTLLRAMQ